MNHATDWIRTVAACVSSLAAVFALVFAVTQILEYRAERKNEMMEKLYEGWTSPTMLLYRAKAAGAFPTGSPHLVEVLAFFERLARSKSNGIITLDDLSYYFQDPLLTYWCGWEDWVRENRRNNRENPDTGELWRGFETVVQEIKEQKKLNCPSKGDIKNNLALEVDRYNLLIAPESARSESAKAGKK